MSAVRVEVKVKFQYNFKQVKFHNVRFRRTSCDEQTPHTTPQELLGEYLAKGLKPDTRIVVYTSAFRRSLDTTHRVLRALGRPIGSDVTVRCHPEIYETGGVYTVRGSLLFSKNGSVSVSIAQHLRSIFAVT